MKNFPIGIKSIFWAILVLISFIPMNVIAETPFYIAIKPGVYFPQSGGLDTGLSGEVAFGYRFTPNIAGEFGLGFFNTKGEATVAGTTWGQEFHINVYPATFTLKAILPYKKWEVFGFGGGGVYVVSIPYDYEDYDHHHHYDHYDYDVIFGGFLGAGIQYNITPRIFAGVEGKYLWTDKVKYHYGGYGAPLTAEFRMDGIISNVLVGFRF